MRLDGRMLFDRSGNRKYLTLEERAAFLSAADHSADPFVRSFCWTLVCTGARISEVCNLTARAILSSEEVIVVECLKRRERGVYRAIPVPRNAIELLEAIHKISALKKNPALENIRLWPWCRTTAWQRVKDICRAAGLPAAVSKPRALRHTFGTIGVAVKGVPLPVMQRWLGHARIESTTIYTQAVGPEERALADRMWSGI